MRKQHLKKQTEFPIWGVLGIIAAAIIPILGLVLAAVSFYKKENRAVSWIALAVSLIAWAFNFMSFYI